MSQVINSSFFEIPADRLAPKLLGKIITHKVGNHIISGRIIEVEAYLGATDQAAHTFKGKTLSNNSAFKSGGHLYIHQIHGKFCLDIAAGLDQTPGSVLIRALQPLEGIEQMKKNRNKEKLIDLCSGPGKLCQALQIDKSFDGIDLTKSEVIYLFDDDNQPASIQTSKRIGISKSTELELRFFLKK